jgi:cadmium resistance protein CadD (predicted permease)
VAGLILAFLGTNVDGFLCVAAAFAVDPPHSRARAILAAAAGFVVLLLVAIAASLVIDRLRAGAGWFGLVPATIGAVRLVRFLRSRNAPPDEDWLSSGASIFSIVLATGADNVAVYAPLFALRSPAAAASIAAAYLALWTIGCIALAYIAPDLTRVTSLKRYLEPVLAVFFIGIGIALIVRGGLTFLG